MAKKAKSIRGQAKSKSAAPKTAALKPIAARDPNEGKKRLLRDLAEVLNEAGLTEIEWKEGGLQIRIAKGGAYIGATAPAQAYAQAYAPAYAPSTMAAPKADGAASAPVTDDMANNPGVVKSPMVGTAYVAAEPGAPAFVKEGDGVKQGQTILIVEAMKTMNPIAAHKSGRVVKIFVQNAQPVEFDQPLMLID